MGSLLKSIFRTGLIIPIIIAFLITYYSYSSVSNLDANKIEPIASTVSTVAGILFGFVMASVTLLASANGNVLIKNTQKTKYLPGLVSRLHRMMAWLLLVCIVFLSCLFIPDTAIIHSNIFPQNTKWVSLVLSFGIFVFSISVIKFIFVWREFSNFVSNM